MNYARLEKVKWSRYNALKSECGAKLQVAAVAGSRPQLARRWREWGAVQEQNNVPGGMFVGF